MENKEFNGLKVLYDLNNLDLDQAISVWKTAKFNADDIKEQINFDIGKIITAEEISQILKVSEVTETDSIVNKVDPYKSTSKYIPDYIKNDERPVTLKFTSKVKNNMERVGQTTFRSKIAGIPKYWKLKNRKADDGTESVYLVAVEEDIDETRI
jgi:hypothetical protein